MKLVYLRKARTLHLHRGEAAKLAHLLESTSLKKKCMNKNYEKICIE